MNQQAYRNIISGNSKNLTAGILRFVLGVIAKGYSLIVSLRNLLYAKHCLKTYAVNVPVISIGNITAGGTGKTPLVIWLCKFLQQKQIPSAILTRGYKTNTQKQKLTDEPAIITESCPQSKVIINPDRVEAATEALNSFDVKVLIMDDGFQHRRLHRNLDIITIDSTCPFGYEKLLPAGLLRESVTSLKRAEAAVITRCDQISKSELNRIEEKLRLINPNIIIAKSIHNPIFAISATGEEIPTEQINSKKTFAFCGIGNPDAFLNTIKTTGFNLVGSNISNDHHRYTNRDINDIYAQAHRLEADLVLTTHKDWTRIIVPKYPKKDITFAYLAIEIKFIAGEDRLKQLIEDTLAGKIHSSQNSKQS